MDISQIVDFYKSDFDSAFAWCESEYQNKFSIYFKDIEYLYERIQSSHDPITDAELEKILTDTPLQLFAASEALSRFKASIQVIKMRVKQEKHAAMLSSDASSQYLKQADASYAVMESEFVLNLYAVVVNRVENQIIFCKELIMSAKKIWTSRKASESTVTSVDTISLPDYSEISEMNG